MIAAVTETIAVVLGLLEQKTIANRKQNYGGNTNRLAKSLSSK
jgi:hypothetical protein